MTENKLGDPRVKPIDYPPYDGSYGDLTEREHQTMIDIMDELTNVFGVPAGSKTEDFYDYYMNVLESNGYIIDPDSEVVYTVIATALECEDEVTTTDSEIAHAGGLLALGAKVGIQGVHAVLKSRERGNRGVVDTLRGARDQLDIELSTTVNVADRKARTFVNAGIELGENVMNVTDFRTMLADVETRQERIRLREERRQKRRQARESRRAQRDHRFAERIARLDQQTGGGMAEGVRRMGRQMMHSDVDNILIKHNIGNIQVMMPNPRNVNDDWYEELSDEEFENAMQTTEDLLYLYGLPGDGQDIEEYYKTNLRNDIIEVPEGCQLEFDLEYCYEELIRENSPVVHSDEHLEHRSVAELEDRIARRTRRHERINSVREVARSVRDIPRNVDRTLTQRAAGDNPSMRQAARLQRIEQRAAARQARRDRADQRRQNRLDRRNRTDQTSINIQRGAQATGNILREMGRNIGSSPRRMAHTDLSTFDQNAHELIHGEWYRDILGRFASPGVGGGAVSGPSIDGNTVRREVEQKSKDIIKNNPTVRSGIQEDIWMIGSRMYDDGVINFSNYRKFARAGLHMGPQRDAYFDRLVNKYGTTIMDYARTVDIPTVLESVDEFDRLTNISHSQKRGENMTEETLRHEGDSGYAGGGVYAGLSDVGYAAVCETMRNVEQLHGLPDSDNPTKEQVYNYYKKVLKSDGINVQDNTVLDMSLDILSTEIEEDIGVIEHSRHQAVSAGRRVVDAVDRNLHPRTATGERIREVAVGAVPISEAATSIRGGVGIDARNAHNTARLARDQVIQAARDRVDQRMQELNASPERIARIQARRAERDARRQARRSPIQQSDIGTFGQNVLIHEGDSGSSEGMSHSMEMYNSLSQDEYSNVVELVNNLESIYGTPNITDGTDSEVFEQSYKYYHDRLINDDYGCPEETVLHYAVCVLSAEVTEDSRVENIEHSGRMSVRTQLRGAGAAIARGVAPHTQNVADSIRRAGREIHRQSGRRTRGDHVRALTDDMRRERARARRDRRRSRAIVRADRDARRAMRHGDLSTFDQNALIHGEWYRDLLGRFASPGIGGAAVSGPSIDGPSAPSAHNPTGSVEQPRRSTPANKVTGDEGTRRHELETRAEDMGRMSNRELQVVVRRLQAENTLQRELDTFRKNNPSQAERLAAEAAERRAAEEQARKDRSERRRKNMQSIGKVLSTKIPDPQDPSKMITVGQVGARMGLEGARRAKAAWDAIEVDE